MNKISGSQTTETCSRRTIILLDNLGVDVGEPEQDGEEGDDGSGTNDGSSGLARAQLVELEGRSTLVDWRKVRVSD